MKITINSLREMGAEFDKEMCWWNLTIGVISYRFAGQDGSWSFGRADYTDDVGWLGETNGDSWLQFIFFVYQVGLELGAKNKLAELHQVLGIK